MDGRERPGLPDATRRLMQMRLSRVCPLRQARRSVVSSLCGRRRQLQGGVETRAFAEGFAREIALAIERVRLGKEARAAALRVRAEETRTSLLSAVSHDLRTPLAAITGAGTALRLDKERLGAARETELIDTICDEAGRMDRLIGNILDMVRLEAGSTAARREWVPVEEVVGPALTRVEDRLVGREVTVDLPADLPLILVDPVLFEHLLFNLVDNAIKHTPPAIPIEVRARVVGGWVEIEVSDRGPGLPPGGEELVFEKFYRGSTARGPGWAWAFPFAAASSRFTTDPSRQKTGQAAARRFECGFPCWSRRSTALSSAASFPRKKWALKARR